MTGNQWERTPSARQQSTHSVEQRMLATLDQYNRVHEELHQRLNQEVSDLEKRVAALRASPTVTSPILLEAYERMIRHKRAFMERWGMGPS